MMSQRSTVRDSPWASAHAKRSGDPCNPRRRNTRQAAQRRGQQTGSHKLKQEKTAVYKRPNGTAPARSTPNAENLSSSRCQDLGLFRYQQDGYDNSIILDAIEMAGLHDRVFSPERSHSQALTSLRYSLLQETKECLQAVMLLQDLGFSVSRMPGGKDTASAEHPVTQVSRDFCDQSDVHEEETVLKMRLKASHDRAFAAHAASAGSPQQVPAARGPMPCEPRSSSGASSGHGGMSTASMMTTPRSAGSSKLDMQQNTAAFVKDSFFKSGAGESPSTSRMDAQVGTSAVAGTVTGIGCADEPVVSRPAKDSSTQPYSYSGGLLNTSHNEGTDHSLASNAMEAKDILMALFADSGQGSISKTCDGEYANESGKHDPKNAKIASGIQTKAGGDQSEDAETSSCATTVVPGSDTFRRNDTTATATRSGDLPIIPAGEELDCESTAYGSRANSGGSETVACTNRARGLQLTEICPQLSCQMEWFPRTYSGDLPFIPGMEAPYNPVMFSPGSTPKQ